MDHKMLVQCRPEGRLAWHVISQAGLRLHSPDGYDLRTVAATASDPQAQYWLGWHPRGVLSPQETRERLSEARVGEPSAPGDASVIELAVTVDRIDGILGGVALAINRELGGWEIGFHIAPAFRGWHIGRGALIAATEFAHQHLGLSTVYAGVERDNEASLRAIWAAGYEISETSYHRKLRNGRKVSGLLLRHHSSSPRWECRSPVRYGARTRTAK